MSIRIERYQTEEQAASVRAFNQRLRERDYTEYSLGERPPAPAGAVVDNRLYLALEDGEVRGGFLLAAFPAEFADGRRVELLNCREPLSEAVINPRYSLLALRLLKFMEQQGPYLFALGMGGTENSFPRLLRGAGWRISETPFLFRIVNAVRVLRQLRPLRSTPLRRVASQAVALTGAGKAAISLLQHRGAVAAWKARGLRIEPVTAWGDWVDALWERWRTTASFAVLRDLATVRELYPLEERTRGFVLRRQGRVAGWLAVLSTPMRDHKHFGNLRVATLLDGVVEPESLVGAIALASRALAREGADLLVTNQSHTQWVTAFRAAGYLPAKSNYILALSKPLSREIELQPGGFAHMHFTRGDSDGRIHL